MNWSRISAFPPAEGDEIERRFIVAPEDAEGLDHIETIHLTGRRDWVAGVHAGFESRVVVRRVTKRLT